MKPEDVQGLRSESEVQTERKESEMKTLLRGGRVVSGEGFKEADILIDGEQIVKLAPEIRVDGEEDVEVTDVTGRWIFPGFIDAHTHFDLAVAGTVTADNFETGTKAAVSGGTTLILDFATQYGGRPYSRESTTGIRRQMEIVPVIMASIWQSRSGMRS